MSQCGCRSVCSCLLCVCTHVFCGIDFCFHFLRGMNKVHLKSLHSSASQETYIRCHQFCKVIVVDAVPYVRAAFHQSYTTVAEGRMRVAGRGEKSNTGFSLSSSCILQDLQVGGGGLQQGASGSKQTRSSEFHAFAEDLVVFEVFTIESEGERGRGKWRERIES